MRPTASSIAGFPTTSSTMPSLQPLLPSRLRSHASRAWYVLGWADGAHPVASTNFTLFCPLRPSQRFAGSRRVRHAAEEQDSPSLRIAQQENKRPVGAEGRRERRGYGRGGWV